MKYKAFSENCEILDSNTVILFGKDSNLVVKIEASPTFAFDLVLEFATDETNKRNMRLEASDNQMKFICTNFEPAGAGTIRPLELATVGGRKVYFRFWTSKEIEEMRKVTYTVFIEQVGGGNNG